MSAPSPQPSPAGRGGKEFSPLIISFSLREKDRMRGNQSLYVCCHPRMFFPPKADQPQAEAGRHNFVDPRHKHSGMTRASLALVLPCAGLMEKPAGDKTLKDLCTVT